MANKITVTPNENTITITESPNSVNLETTVTPVTVTQVSTNYVQVNTDIGPAGPVGPQGPAASTGSLVTTASISDNVITFTKGNESTFDITIGSSSFATTSSRALTSNTSLTSDKVYVDTDNANSTFYIPMMGVPAGDTYYGLQLPVNHVYYQPRTTVGFGNPIADRFDAQGLDQLTIGRGANTAGAIFLNSTVDKPSIVYSDEPLYLQSYDQLYLTASVIAPLSNVSSSAGFEGDLIGTASFAHTSSAVTVELDNDIDLGVVPLISNTATSQSALISPEIKMFYDQEGLAFGNTVAKFRIGQGNPIDRPGTIELHGGPNSKGYITTFNAHLQITPTNNKDLILSASGNGSIKFENSITASNDISASGDILGTTGSFEGGLILTAPNGNRFRVNVSNTGVINTNGPI